MILEFSLCFSLVANVVLAFFLTRASKRPKKVESYDCRQLLHDLTAGQALVKIERIAPADVFIRSPRN